MKKRRPIFLIFLLIVALAVGAVDYYYYKHPKASFSSSSTTSSNQPVSTGLTQGIDDQSLQTDLKTLDTGMTQDDQSLQNSNAAVNDKQLPVKEQ